MLFSFPSFLGVKEQDRSERLYNNIKVLVQTHIGEIWIDTDFGTNIREHIKQGLTVLVIDDICVELENKINYYFNDQLIIKKLNAWQEADKIRIELVYTELRTGKQYTLLTEDIIVNNDTSLY